MDTPETIAHYRVLSMIGQGGMGVVYHATHQDTDQVVALKTMRAPSASRIASIRREIQALARLRHPNVVAIIDEGLHEGLPWYAMPLLEGSSLRQHQQTLSRPTPEASPTMVDPRAGVEWGASTTDEEGAAWTPPRGHAETPIAALALSSLEALQIIGALCSPLAYLHGEGVVHRDLKPENIIIEPDGQPVLLDFGLVTRVSGARGRESLDQLEGFAGTAAYMAPEQIQGGWVDARADLYALGCILYELLTGRPPFVGPSPQSVLIQHVNSPPAPPSRYAAELPGALDALLMQLLAKNPRDRLGHAADVATRLRAMGVEWTPREDTPTPRTYLYRPGLAGRSETLARLDAQLDALGQGRGGVALLGGESGVGKTRLVMALTRRARDRGAAVYTGECLAHSPGPLQALRRTLQGLADRCYAKGPRETERLFGAHAHLFARYEPHLEQLPGIEAAPQPPGLKGAKAKRHLMDALAELFGRLSEAAPLLLVLDDLQWADALLLEWLHDLASTGRFESLPVMILGTWRTEESTPTLDALGDSPGVESIRLTRLGEDAIAAMVADMLALRSPPQGFVDFLARRSEGNPFFVAEYLRVAVEEKLLGRDEVGRWRLGAHALSDGALEALPLPGGLRDVIARRLGGLESPTRHLLEVAAILGREAPLDRLTSLSGLETGALTDAVRTLRRREVFEVTPGGALRFVHDKFREVTLDGLAAPRRQALHMRAAEAMADHAGTLHDLSELGRHWAGAGRLDEARRCYLAAARQARMRYIPEEAARCFTAYLELPGDPTDERVEVRLELARDVLIHVGQPREAEAQYQQALSEAQTLGARRLEGRSRLGLADILRQTGHLDEAHRLYETALEIHREVDDRRAEGHVLGCLANLNKQQGRVEVARTLYETALEIHHDVGDSPGEARVLVSLAGLCKQQGLLTSAHSHYRAALVINRALGDRRGEGIVLSSLAHLLEQRGQLGEAQALYEDALSIHREIKNRRSEGITLGNLAYLLILRGDYVRARDALRSALQIAREVSDRFGEGVILGALAAWHHAQGALDDAHGCYRAALTIHREVGNRTFEARALCARARLARHLSRSDQAHRYLIEARAMYHNLDDPFGLTLTLCEQGHQALWRREPADDSLNQARRMMIRVQAGAQSELGVRVARLVRAVEAFARGEPLEHGEATSPVLP